MRAALERGAAIDILYVLPWDTTYRYKAAFVPSLSYQPLTLAALAALTPARLGARVTLVDEGVMEFDYARHGYDVVGISICTSSSARGYELADRFRAEGSHVLVGGHHATLLPEEAAGHADSVFAGPAERTLPAFFDDYLRGAAKPLYRSCGFDAAMAPEPMRGLMPRKGYLRQPTVIADFGCANSCRYCVVHSFWGPSARRPVGAVVDEIRRLGAKEFLFLDPSPFSDREYAKGLLEALAPLGINWAGLAALDVAADDELLGLMSRSGCVGALLGYETFRQEDLDSMGKYKNKASEYRRIADKLHERGIAILGAFMLGFDGDTPESVGELPALVEHAKIDVPRFAVLTPFPATPLFRRLESEGRILHTDWSKYDCAHCVFEPKNMTARQLEAAFLKAWKGTYSLARLAGRAMRAPQRRLAALATNVGFRIYARRLEGLL